MSKCTPAYNDETRRLMAHAADLRRVAKGAESGDFGDAARAKARQVIDAGETDPEKVVDAVHEFLNEHVPLAKDEVAAMIAETKPRTRSEAAQRRAEVLAQLRDANAAKNKAALTRLTKQRDELTRQLETNDFPEPVKRAAPKYGDDVKAAQRDVARLKTQIEGVIEKGKRLNATPLQRTLDVLHSAHLFNIFTSLMVLPKLGAAVLGGHLHALTSGATVSMARLIPALRRIADKAPDYGAGLSVDALAARYGKQGLSGLVGDTLKGKGAAVETMQHGASKLELSQGDIGRSSDAFLGHIGTLSDALNTEGKLNKATEATRVLASYPARSHGFIKQFLSHPAFYESVANQTLQIGRALKAAGKTDEQIAEFLNRESTQSTINTRAIARAYDEKMQGKNRWNDAMVGWISQMEKLNHPGANIAAFVARSVLPVVRVGPNVFKQGTSLLLGGVKAALESAGKGEMTPERADYIMKNIGAQGTGALLVALGMVFNKYFGGIEGAEAKKKGTPAPDTIKPGETSIGGLSVGSFAFHGAPAAMLQMGAGLVHVYEQEMKLNHDDAINAALYSIGSNVKNWGERTLPITDQMRRISNTLEYGRNHGKEGTPWGEVAGNQLRSMLVPQLLQQEAARQDPDKRYPRPRNIAEDLKSGIPGKNFRESVPHSGTVRQP